MPSTVISSLYRYSFVNFALIDQGLISAVNFCTGIILARNLGTHGFGRYTLLWLCVLFVNSFQVSVILSPLMNIGPKQLAKDRQPYFAAVFAQQVIFSALSFFLLITAMLTATVISPDLQLRHLALPLGAVACSCQFQDFFRRLFFVMSHPARALLIDAVRYLGQAFVLLVFCQFPHFTLESVFWLIAASSAASVFLCLPHIGRLRLTRGAFFSALSRNWMFSRWLAPSTLIWWISSHLHMALSGVLLGSAQAGAMKACENVLGFSHVLTQSLQNIVPLAASRRFHRDGTAGLRKYLGWVALLAGGSFAISYVVVVSLSNFWLSLFYGSDYAVYAFVLRWYALIYIISFLSSVFEFGLRAMEDTRPIFLALCGGTSLTLLAGYYLISNYALQGAMFGIMATSTINLIILWYFFNHSAQRSADLPSHS